MGGLRSLHHPGLNGQSKLFWSDFTAKKIQSATSTVAVSDLVTGLSNLKATRPDLQNNKVYWIDAGNGKLQRGNPMARAWRHWLRA